VFRESALGLSRETRETVFAKHFPDQIGKSPMNIHENDPHVDENVP